VYRIRFHGRGGQGIKTASRVLGAAFFAEGYAIQDAPRYGAERRGAPIFAYVRAARTTIDERGVISNPDLVVVADDTLIGVAAAGVLAGVTERTTVLLHTAEPAETWRDRLRLGSVILSLFPPEQAGDLDPRFAGVAAAGAAARLVGAIPRSSLERAAHDEVSYLGSSLAARNVAQALEAYDRMAPYHGLVREGGDVAASRYVPPAWVDLPLDETWQSAPAVHAAASSVASATGLWRTMRPVIHPEHCHRCWWICVTLCPDGAISVGAAGIPEIDYEHCKGCLVCVAVCPHHAIEALPEKAAASHRLASRGSP
jgi:pyruvate ferredoxin oxidoreductase gamma subunit